MSIISENPEMAIILVKGHMQHLITDPTAEELRALAEAADAIFMERLACYVKAMQEPAEMLKPFDGGATARAEVKRLAYMLSSGGN